MARRRTRRLNTLMLLGLALLVARPAFAEIPSPPTAKPSAADEAAAKKNFETGLKLYGEGAYAEALVAFEASYRLGGRHTALKNIAQCHRNLKHFVDAYEAYEQLLSVHGTKLAPADKKAVEQALEELSLLTGTLSINVNEADAGVEVDGKVIGKSPLRRPVRASVGGHRIRVEKAGFEPYEQNVGVASQEAKSVDVTLAPEKNAGHVVVREPFGREVHVLIDGEDKGPAPWEGDVGAGEHVIEAKGPVFAADPRKVAVVAKQRLDITLDAQPLKGHLRVTTIPVSAKILIDGREAGTGVWEGDLPAGVHKVEASMPGEPSQTREVRLTRGQNVVQEIPILGAIAAGKTDYHGVYIALTLDPSFLVSGFSSNYIQNAAVEDSERWSIAGSSTLRAGYAFGWLSAELVGAFMFEYREQKQSITQIGKASATIADKTTSPNAFVGLGPRITTKDDLVRFTIGVAPGIAIRNFNLNRETNLIAPPATGTKQQDLSASYTAFALNMEAGLLLGSTPGAKLFVGAHAWIDFPGEDTVAGPESISALSDASFRAPNRGVIITSGTQFFVGPVLGVRFGQ
jgi:hypothetical protein